MSKKLSAAISLRKHLPLILLGALCPIGLSPVSASLWAADSQNNPEPKTEAAQAPSPATEKTPTASISAETGKDAGELVREGLALYTQKELDGARTKFMAADATQPETPEIAFDLGCAYQRKGDRERAIDQYNKASQSRDKSLASAARFNLGCLEAEAGQKLAGEKPEDVPPDKRQPILEALVRAVGHYRDCLAYDSGHQRARHNLELIRQWIKYYADRWRQQDREKRRQESNLLQFLDYLISTQEQIKKDSSLLAEDPHPKGSRCAEAKRAQEDLLEEIPELKKKIEQLAQQAQQALQAQQSQQAPAATPPVQGPAGMGVPAGAPKLDPELEKGIKQLTDWAGEAGQQMTTATAKLDARDLKPAVEAQGHALEKLEAIWEAVIPFKPLLVKNLEAQTQIAGALKPEEKPKDPAAPKAEKEEPKSTPPSPAIPKELTELAQQQEKTARRTALMAAKAQQELKQLEKNPPPAGGNSGHPGTPQPTGPDAGKVIVEGLKKAIELAPKAVEHQTLAKKHLEAGNQDLAYPEAEEARKILEEIAKDQPQDPKQNQDQKQNDQKEQQKEQQQKQEEQKKQEQKNKDNQDKKQQEAKPKPGEMSKDQAEAVLRKVREREQDRRRKQEEFRAQMADPDAVDMDW